MAQPKWKNSKAKQRAKRKGTSMADAPVKDFRDKKVDEHPIRGVAVYESIKGKSGGKTRNWSKLFEDSNEIVWAFDSGSEDTYNMVAKKPGGQWLLRFEKVENGLAVDGTQILSMKSNKREARAEAVELMRNHQSMQRLESYFPGIGL